MNDLSTAVTILSAMITPAVLISACGSLIIATANRLGRMMDRTRKIAEQYERLNGEEMDDQEKKEERSVLFNLLGRTSRRSRLLQRSMAALYLALSVFVATSVAIGLVAIMGSHYSWLPIALGIIGAGLLFYSSLLLIYESRIALSSVDFEMDFVIRHSRLRAPAELLKSSDRRTWRFWKSLDSEEKEFEADL